MAMAVSWLVGTALMFLVFGVLACSALGSKRRPRFSARLICAAAAVSAVAVVVAFAITFSALPQRAFGLVWVALLLAALVAAPVFCYHTFAPFRGPSEGDGGGGPGSDPPSPVSGLPGGAPLPDADQARTRRRDHSRPRRRGVSRRRPADQPVPSRRPAVRGRL